MRLFWTCIGVLMLLAGGVLAARSARTQRTDLTSVEPAAAARSEHRAPDFEEPAAWEGSSEARTDAEPMTQSQNAAETRAPTILAEDGPVEEGEPAPQTGEALETETPEIVEEVGPEMNGLPGPEQAGETSAQGTESESTGEKPANQSEPEPVHPEAQEAAEVPNKPDGAPVAPEVVEPATPDAPADRVDTPQNGGTAPPVDSGVKEPPQADGPPKPPVVWEQEDGSLLINGKYVVRGKGTEQEPYELPWELLTAAREEYNPRDGKNTLPAWTREFQDTHVKITGYLLLPLVGETFDELLVMRNQWDGCCIGVPPTAYDAVEVKLASTSTLSRLQVNYGSITGVFKVDPYLSGKWLIGLYLMEECTLADMSGVGVGGQ